MYVCVLDAYECTGASAWSCMCQGQRRTSVSSSIILPPYCIETGTDTESEVCALGQVKADELSGPAYVNICHYA